MKAIITDKDWIFYWCDGCKSIHDIPFGQNSNGWSFSGDSNNPTLSPSIKTSTGWLNTDQVICHHFLKNGNIEYCADSPHELSGQIIELKDVAEVRRKEYDSETIFEHIIDFYLKDHEKYYGKIKE
jgi:hypothetical protein